MAAKSSKLTLKSLQIEINMLREELNLNKKELSAVKEQLKTVEKGSKNKETLEKSNENVANEFICKNCDLHFMSKKKLKMHYQLEHTPNITCENCEEKFVRNCDLE